MKRGQRYEKARRTLDLNQSELAEKTGLTQTSISMMERDRVEKPNFKYTNFLVENNFSRDWLVNGKGEMYSQDNKSFINNKTSFDKNDNSEINEEEFPKEATELLEKILEQQQENNKQLDKMLNSLTSAYATIEKLTNRLLNTESNLGKHKAYTLQPLFSNNGVYAHS
jgi:transcriptional regulator with XRE-family HTH domain